VKEWFVTHHLFLPQLLSRSSKGKEEKRMNSATVTACHHMCIDHGRGGREKVRLDQHDPVLQLEFFPL